MPGPGRSTTGGQSPSELSKSEMVHAQLRERILRGDYAPGTRLVLSRMASDFGVSPVPVREAVRRLEAEGLVRFTRNVGAEVLGMNTREYAEAMETVAHLEGAATALAAPLISRVDLARARSSTSSCANAGARWTRCGSPH